MLARFCRISTSAFVRRASSLPPPLGLAEVQEAAARIARSGVSRTPVIHSAWINEQCGLSVHFKCEHLQRTGSFKFRGAANAVMQLSDERAAKGVVAHSAGNHGAALAAAAAMRCIPCSVIVPRGTSEAKLDNMRRYGANVILCEPNQQARVEAAAAEAARMGGAASIHPYDQAEVIAGQGTIALELLEQSPNLDAILTPTSGGGMLAGIAVAARALKPGLRVIAVEPRGKRLGEALSKGQRVLDPSTANRLLDTCADAIRSQVLGEQPWALAQQLVDHHVLSVGDNEIATATHTLLTELKQVVEPAAAVTLAALMSPGFASLQDKAIASGRPLKEVALILCGGNVDLDSLQTLVSKAKANK